MRTPIRKIHTHSFSCDRKHRWVHTYENSHNHPLIINLIRGKCGRSTKVKGLAIPLQAWTGPEGSRRWRLPDFMTVST
jgi:hypothetical protein